MAKRILFTTEASFLSTGYAVYAREVMRRLHDMGFELAELGSYSQTLDPRAARIPWRFYGALPDSPEEGKGYEDNVFNQFGAAKFEPVLLSFRPDVCFGYRDSWMMLHEAISPLRHCFSYFQMPTVDSFQQDPSWLEMYASADKLFTYQDWSIGVLRREGGDLMKIASAAPPGVDQNVFKPVADKAAHKEQWLDKDAKITGMVGRNQLRKLFPDLIKSYSDFLSTLDASEAKNHYLYIHTSYPDQGWKLEDLLTQSGLSHKVLFTYTCQDSPNMRGCGHWEPRFYSGPITRCPRCGQVNLTMTNPQKPVADAVLSQIYNLFDVYVQYSISEGFGIPMVEAAACGVPLMGTDYSAMCDIIPKCKGTLLPVSKVFTEPVTGMLRVYPDDGALIRELRNFYASPEIVRKGKSAQARQGVERWFTWERTAKILADAFDAAPEADWTQPPRMHQPAAQIPNFPSNEDFVSWAIVYVLGMPERLHTYFHMKLVKDLNSGCTTESLGGPTFSDSCMLATKAKTIPFTRQNLIDQFRGLRQKANYWESRRASNH